MKNFRDITDLMKRQQMPLPSQKVEIQIPAAEKILREALLHFLQAEGREMQWLPEYEKVAGWLAGNRGKGLFLYGNCGRGKSLLCRYARILPAGGIGIRHASDEQQYRPRIVEAYHQYRRYRHRRREQRIWQQAHGFCRSDGRRRKTRQTTHHILQSPGGRYTQPLWRPRTGQDKVDHNAGIV